MPRKARAWSQNQKGTRKPRTLTSATVTEVAWTFTRTSWSLGVGFGTSRNFRTLGGPYFVHTMAFIVATAVSVDVSLVILRESPD